MFYHYPLVLLSLFAGGIVGHESHDHDFHSLSRRSEGSFSYHGITGPLNWYSLDKEKNKLCAKGRHQSPIDIVGSCGPTANNPTLKIPSAPKGAKFENKGTTVEVTTNGTLTKNGVTSKLAQFHFHTPSEHSVNGEYFPMEAHFVFKGASTFFGLLCPGAIG